MQVHVKEIMIELKETIVPLYLRVQFTYRIIMEEIPKPCIRSYPSFEASMKTLKHECGLKLVSTLQLYSHSH